jgi:hypothetical protein
MLPRNSLNSILLFSFALDDELDEDNELDDELLLDSEELSEPDDEDDELLLVDPVALLVD